MSHDFSKITVVVTGGGSGIGAAIARGFAAAGAAVVIGGRDETKLIAVAGEATGPIPIRYRAVDVADRASATAFIEWSLKTLGRIDVLVNGAGINIKTRTMAEMKPEQWDEVLGVNATGAYNCLYSALPGMRAQKSGLVINISSVAGKRALKLGGIAYDASKFAMTALGTAVGQEEATNGIRVTNIYPGEVDTPIMKNRAAPLTDEHRARILIPEDVAAAVLFVASLPSRVHLPEIVIKPLSQDYC